eukprot:g853.t1
MPVLDKSIPAESHSTLEESQAHLSLVTGAVCVFGLFWVLWVKTHTHSYITRNVRRIGVAIGKVRRSAREIERKTFHLCALLVPAVYQTLLAHGASRDSCRAIAWTLCSCTWAFDLLRLYQPGVNDWFKRTPFGKLMRQKEHNQLAGGCYLSLGCTLAIHFFPPAIAVCSIMFLVLGDMWAALIGVSFGGDMVVVKLGREGKKSAEGSLAMFVACFFVGLLVFSDVYLSEYAVFVGALMATVVELHEPFGLNDNLTIPVLSGFALTWGFARVHQCSMQVVINAEAMRSQPSQPGNL